MGKLRKAFNWARGRQLSKRAMGRMELATHTFTSPKPVRIGLRWKGKVVGIKTRTGYWLKKGKITPGGSQKSFDEKGLLRTRIDYRHGMPKIKEYDKGGKIKKPKK